MVTSATPTSDADQPDEGRELASESESRRRRRCLWLGVVLLVIVVLRLALPFGVRLAIESGVEGALGLKTHVENVDLWIARGGVAVEGLRVFPASVPLADPPSLDGVTPLLRLERLYANLEWLDLLRGQLRVAELALGTPAVALLQPEDGPINPFPRTETGAREDPEPPEPESGGLPLALQLDQLLLSDIELRVNAERGGEELARFTLDELLLTDLSFADGEIGLGDVAIAHPAVHVERSFLFAQRAGGDADEPASGAVIPESPHRLKHVSIERADFTLLTSTGPLNLWVGLDIAEVQASAGHQFPIRFDLGIEDGLLTLDGQAGLVPPSYAGSLVWTDLPVPPATLLANPELLPWLQSFRSSGDLQLSLRVEQGSPVVELSGRTRVDELTFADPKAKELVVELKSLETVVREATLDLATHRAHTVIESVELVDPVLHYTHPPDALDELLQALAGGAQPDGTGRQQTEQERAFEASTEIERFELTGGTVQYHDRTLSPPAAVAIREASLRARDITWPELGARDVQVKALTPERAPFALTGSLGPDKARFDARLTRMELRPFGPFAAQAGYDIARGQLSLELDLRRTGSSIETTTALSLHDLRVDARGASAFQANFGVPIDLALALLRDPQGDIKLTLPVTLAEGKLEVGLATIARDAMRRALEGALTSPLKLAGMLVGGDGSAPRFEPLELPAGEVTLPDAARARTRALAELLQQRPGIAIRLEGRAGAADAPRIAEQMLRERAAGGKDLPRVEGAGFFARRRVAGALKRRARGEIGQLSAEDAALLERYIAAVAVPPERLRALAAARAEELRAALLEDGAAAEQIALVEPVTAAEPSIHFRLEGS